MLSRISIFSCIFIITTIIHGADQKQSPWDQYPLALLLHEPFAEHPNICCWHDGLSTYEVRRLARVKKILNSTINDARKKISDQNPHFNFPKDILFNKEGAWCTLGRLKPQSKAAYILFGNTTSPWRSITPVEATINLSRIGIRSRTLDNNSATQLSTILAFSMRLSARTKPTVDIIIMPRINEIWKFIYAGDATTIANLACVTRPLCDLASLIRSNHDRYVAQENPPITLACEYGVKPVEYTVTVQLDHPEFANIKNRVKQLAMFNDQLTSNSQCECTHHTISEPCKKLYAEATTLLYNEESNYAPKKHCNTIFEQWHMFYSIGTIAGAILYVNPRGEVILTDGHKKKMLTNELFIAQLKTCKRANDMQPFDVAQKHALECTRFGDYFCRTINNTVHIFDPYKKNVTSSEFDGAYAVTHVMEDLSPVQKAGGSVCYTFVQLVPTTKKDHAILWAFICSSGNGIFEQTEIPFYTKLDEAKNNVRNRLYDPGTGAVCIKAPDAVIQELFDLIRMNKLGSNKESKCIVS